MSKNITGGDPIRGSLDPYQGTLIEQLKNDIDGFHARGTIAPEEFYYKLRNAEKEDVGELFRRAASQCKRYMRITDGSRDIIREYLEKMERHPHCHTFVNCVLDSYNDDMQPNRLNPPHCKTTEIKKAIQHASKDSMKGMNTYVKPVLKYIEEHEEYLNSNILGRYRDISGAVAFTCHYFMNLFCGRMPRVMSAAVFNETMKLDRRLAQYYVLNVDTDQYRQIGKRKIMCRYLNQECITQIICSQKER